MECALKKAKVSHQSTTGKQATTGVSSKQNRRRRPKRADYTRKRKQQQEQELERKVKEYKANIKLPKLSKPPLNWHDKDDVKKKFDTFYNEKSKTPKEDIQDTPITHLKDKLEDFVKKHVKDWCKRVEHTGSIYEGLKINDGLEFDLMFVMRGGKQFNISEVTGRPGYVYLCQNKERRRRSLLNKLLVKKKCLNGDEDDVEDVLMLSPEMVISKFQSVVQKFLGQKEQVEDDKKRILRRHGPAIQLDVMTKDEILLYSVDLVPSYEIITEEGAELYVPKPPKASSGEYVNAWRKSFSPMEKQKLRSLDENNDCRRQVIRFLKGLCKEESTLNTITSYYWKTLLFHAMDQNNNGWTEVDRYRRTFELIEYMAKLVEQKNFPQYFLKEMNLFQDLDEKHAIQISSRLTALYTNEKKFLKAVNSCKNAEKEVNDNSNDEIVSNSTINGK